MTDIERYIQHDLDDLLQSVAFEPRDDQTKAYLWKQAGSLLRYQAEIGTISDYIVDVRLSNDEVKVILRYKLSPTDDDFKMAASMPKIHKVIYDETVLSAAQLPPSGPQQGGSYQPASSQGTIYSGGAGHGTFSVAGQPYTSIGASVVPGNGIGTVTSQLQQAKSRSPKLPPIIFEEHDDTGVLIRMTLTPDWQLTATDSLKISAMLFSAATQPYSFSAHAYVKANQLERHFTFKAV
jgi:hypothetical protein